MDPMTIITAALVLGASSGLTSATEQLVKDLYSGLKALVQSRHKGVDWAQLESGPATQEKREALAKEISLTGIGSDKQIVRQSAELLRTIVQQNPGTQVFTGIKRDEILLGLPIELQLATTSEQRVLLTEKVKRLRSAYAIETDVAVKLKLEVQIGQAETELSSLGW